MILPFTLNPVLRASAGLSTGPSHRRSGARTGPARARLIKLASNENPLGPSPAALAAMRKRLAAASSLPGRQRLLFQAKAGGQTQVWNRGNLILGNGSNDIIEFLGHALMGPGDGSRGLAILFCHLSDCGAVARGQASSPCRPRITATIWRPCGGPSRRKTKIVFVANPNNPTGTLAPADGGARWSTPLPPNVVLAMDEAYIEFLDDPLDLLPLIRCRQKPNLILHAHLFQNLRPGRLRLGYGIGHPDFIAALEKIRQPFNINSLAQAAGLAALDDRRARPQDASK